MDDVHNKAYAYNLNRKPSKSVMYCAVPMCGNKSNKNPEFVYHSFPKKNQTFVYQTNYFGKYEKVDKFLAWQNALKMKSTTKVMFVCSKHFKKEDYVLPDLPSQRRRLLRKAVPSCNLPLTDPTIENKVEINEARDVNAESKQKYKSEFTENVENQNNMISFVTVTTNELLFKKFKEPGSLVQNLQDDPLAVIQVSKNDETNTNTKCLRKDFSTQVTSGDFGIKFIDLLKSDSDLSTVTGIESFALFRTILDIAEHARQKEVHHSGKLSLEDRIILTFMKLKQNLSYVYLAVYFQISPNHCQNVFQNTIQLLSTCLRHVIEWPSREQISTNIPLCFKDLKNVRVVLSCTNVYIQRPKNLCNQQLTNFHYKSSNTCKIMIGVTPSGNISFISKVYRGNDSDETIFEQSGLIKLLEPEDSLIVDRGLLIDEVCNLHNIKCIKPPLFKNQLDSILTQNIAGARAHIKKINQRIKAFKIIGDAIPVHLIPLLEEIFIVICGIVNLSSLTLKDDKFMI